LRDSWSEASVIYRQLRLQGPGTRPYLDSLQCYYAPPLIDGGIK